MSASVSRRSFLQLSAAGAATSLAGLGLPALARTPAANKPLPFGVPATGDVYIGANEYPLGPCQAAQEAMAAILPYGNRYLRDLQKGVVEVFAQQEGVPADHVVAYPGSSEPLEFATLAFASPQASLVTADPSYENPWRTAGRIGAQIHRVPLREDYSHDVRAMCAADPKAGMLYICSPNNPTGTVTPRRDIEYALANKPAGSVLVVDEAYIHFSEERSAIDLVGTGEDVVVLRTFSKLYGMAGIRLGFAVARPQLLARMKHFFSANYVPVTAAAAGIASMQDPEVVPQRRGENRRVLKATVDWLTARGHACSASDSNCFLVEVGRPAAEFSAAMAELGVHVGRNWPIWPTRPRISVGTAEEMARFRQAFARVMG
ncbi:pyridoxal phosphate-dependent aminotransferase [Stenotrophomonas sp. MMGLT7]|uniref:pyridoxal phosphate-dependent aminotransferase n=1 Tax=Stenotrophomonas sp. MMGLT7 TaxID=2901227 RepID=UPI001E57658A|nr:pyridoxal phosphate-dependent aminotransferase [Stenotrophomonas sp. MMGLT7]MCD7098474.1 pyridoxal phosphate-dependent aminotransferase [Stenotrophomonas sp. MMGLT7]